MTIEDRALHRGVLHRLAIEIDVLPLDSPAARDLEPEHDVAAPVARIDAEQTRRARLAGLTVLHRAVLHVEVHAFEILARDEVHDAGHGVGAVHRGGAARDDLDALDRGRRDRVQVDGHRRVDGHRTIAVEQHEVAIRAEAAQAQHRGARCHRRAREDELAVLDLRVTRRRGHELRELVQRVFHRDRALRLERGSVDRLDRAVRFIVAPDDARTRDDYFLERRLLLGFLPMSAR